MLIIPNLLRWIAVPFAMAFLAACGSSDSAAVKVIAIGDKDEPFEKGIYLSLAAQLTRAATSEGLVSFNAEGRVIPALADRWIVTDDGKSYIFRLRDGTWRGGGQITAGQARIALNDAIRALRGSSLARDLNGIAVIRVMTGRVVEIRLARPMPHFLQLLAQPELGLRYQGKIAGPMALERIDDRAVLTPIKPAKLGLPAIEHWSEMTRQVWFEATSGEEAVQRLNRGDADIVLGGTIENFPLSRKVGILRGTIQLDPVSGLFGLLVTKSGGFLAEPENREAIAMAIDRDKLITPFGLDGWISTTRVVAPGQAGDNGTIGERWDQVALEDRKAEAAARVALWQERQEDQAAIRLSVWLPTGPGSDMLFSSLAQDMAAVGIELLRAGDANAAQLRLIDDVARYPRATWFLNRLACGAKRGLCDKSADALVGVPPCSRMRKSS
jgi:peptide/nickel transport system substrate-binding protein/oligopeptide transport system substrate-binding protein